jgi:hypothetical protein
MARFAFRFHPLYRLAGFPFGVTPRTTMVEVVNDRLTIRFGPWLLRTHLNNVIGCEPAGPFSVLKTAGPAHLSLVDRGLTCATNPQEGLCLRFSSPVAAMDPFGWIRHPGVTVTVERPDDLRRAVTQEAAASNDDRLEAVVEVVGESPWAVVARRARRPLGMGVAAVRYTRTWREVQRTFESSSGAPQTMGDDPADVHELQPAGKGVGALFERTYRIRISGATRTPEELVDVLVSNLNAASPVEVTEFEKLGPAAGGTVGAEYLVHMPGPWNGPVRVVHRTPNSFRLGTLAGHMEAGQIVFTAWAAGDQEDDRELVFEIRSVARSGDRLFRSIYERMPITRELQLHMWVHFCRRVAELAGGRAAHPIEARTVRYG